LFQADCENSGPTIAAAKAGQTPSRGAPAAGAASPPAARPSARAAAARATSEPTLTTVRTFCVRVPAASPVAFVAVSSAMTAIARS
jgi:hypothetical protein